MRGHSQSAIERKLLVLAKDGSQMRELTSCNREELILSARNLSWMRGHSQAAIERSLNCYCQLGMSAR